MNLFHSRISTKSIQSYLNFRNYLGFCGDSIYVQMIAFLRYLGYIQQRKLRLSPFEQHGMAFTLVVAESDILPINVPVTRLQFPDQRAFGYFPVPQQTVWTDIVGDRGKEQTIFPELPEHCAELS